MNPNHMSDEVKFNILRGVVLGSLLESKQKRELLAFIDQLEEEAKA